MVNFTLVSDDVRRQFNPPCDELIIDSNNQKSKGRKVEEKCLTKRTASGMRVVSSKTAHYLDFNMRQVNNRYQMITNNREFSLENCLSGIGGFIGMFVGLSLRQIPGVLCSFYQYFCQFKNNIESD